MRIWNIPNAVTPPWENLRGPVSGLDEEPGREGGTWLGASRHGRIACLVNISQRQDENKKGRGFLVTNFLTTSESIESYAERIISERDDYNGFILTLIELGRTGSKVARVTNDAVTNTPLLFMHPSSNDWYSLGNSSVEVCWQKVGEGEARFRRIVQTYRPVTSRDTLTHNLLNMMADSTRFLPDPVLQKAGEDCGWSQESTDSKAALFVWDPLRQYGTRTTTVLTVDGSGNCDYTEKTLQQPEKTLQQPEKTLQQPEKTLQQPEKTLQQPEKTLQQPEKTLQQPEKTLQQPEKTLQQPEKTLQQPEKTLQQPEKTLQQPEKTLQQPEKTLQQPEKTLQQPEKTLQQPEKTLQQPEKTLQQPEKTLQRPENNSPLPLSAVSLQWSTVHYRYQLEPSSSL
ncbi:hypothetical protein ACOMHN_029056 [Nucella lapillus]